MPSGIPLCRRIAGNVTKQAPGTAKINPSMSLLNTVALMSGNPPVPDLRTTYEDRRLLVL